MAKRIQEMPVELKEKLREFDRHASIAKNLFGEISEMIEDYGVPFDNLVANSDIFSDEPHTEALAYISNSEGHIEENIAEVEKVFLYYANKGKK
ncbi:hypothetical protein CN495_07840 [Bacillus thuringiensis]|uniref:Uncharacterized protein n=1 Tax=Bacillus thuringiensis TaxID=1428 RepID=A0ABD6S9D6_BACTU|nr:hypothetical protein [Bacillus thuringiensis]PER55655.1 hypothetical protein CN495_07840 [Bacillus thuringiensis]